MSSLFEQQYPRPSEATRAMRGFRQRRECMESVFNKQQEIIDKQAAEIERLKIARAHTLADRDEGQAEIERLNAAAVRQNNYLLSAAKLAEDRKAENESLKAALIMIREHADNADIGDQYISGEISVMVNDALGDDNL